MKDGLIINLLSIMPLVGDLITNMGGQGEDVFLNPSPDLGRADEIGRRHGDINP